MGGGWGEEDLSHFSNLSSQAIDGVWTAWGGSHIQKTKSLHSQLIYVDENVSENPKSPQVLSAAVEPQSLNEDFVLRAGLTGFIQQVRKP